LSFGFGFAYFRADLPFVVIRRRQRDNWPYVPIAERPDSEPFRRKRFAA
jgi:hypothetical protein